MNNQNLSLGSVISTVISALLCGVVLYALLEVYVVLSMNCGNPALVFAIINLMIIIINTGCRRSIIQRISFATYVQLTTITVVYTVLQFGQLFFAVNSWGTSAYILYHLAILVLWLAAMRTVVSFGLKKRHS